MADHVWSVLCESSSIDRDSGQVSLHNGVDRITIRDESIGGMEGKGIFRPMHFVTQWTRSEAERPESGWTAKVTLEPPGGRPPVNEHTYELGKLNDHVFYRVRITYLGLPSFRGLGTYRFRVELNNPDADEWREVASVPFLVVHQPPEPGGGDAESGAR